MTAITQKTIPYDPFAEARLPGIAPLALCDWLVVDDAYAAQMAERQRLISQHPADVIALAPDARAAAGELLESVVEHVTRKLGFEHDKGSVVCPDGRKVSMDRDDPLRTLGQIVQEDFCILQKIGEQHVLTGAILCFPASWTLSEKFCKPLIDIHIPVDSYDENIARRVQRLFDGVRVARPLWRKNVMWYATPDLYHPRKESDPREGADPKSAGFLRSERQTLLRLPRTGAVVFGIHTFVLNRADAVLLSEGDLAAP